MNFLISLCLLCMLAILATTVIKLCSVSRGERLRYLKNFKKGKFALIYLAALPLYWIGLVYDGSSIGKGLLSAIKCCVELVVLKYDHRSVAALCEANLFYRITMDLCFLLVALNAILFSFTIVGQKFTNQIRKCKAQYFAKKIYVVVGHSPSNELIIKSFNDEKRKKR